MLLLTLKWATEQRILFSKRIRHYKLDCQQQTVMLRACSQWLNRFKLKNFVSTLCKFRVEKFRKTDLTACYEKFWSLTFINCILNFFMTGESLKLDFYESLSYLIFWSWLKPICWLSLWLQRHNGQKKDPYSSLHHCSIKNFSMNDSVLWKD